MSENKNRLRIHTQLTPESAAPPSGRYVRWKSLPHPGNRHSLSRTDRFLRNCALSCAVLLSVLALGNINHPWAHRASETVERALTMHIDLDESIGSLSFVRNLIPESALVFLNLSGDSEFAVPVSGELTHPYTSAQPWLLFACPDNSPVCAVADGFVTAVSELSDGKTGLLVDHGNSLESVYACLISACVQPGDAVVRGQTLGAANGELYFELREGEAPVDPAARMGF